MLGERRPIGRAGEWVDADVVREAIDAALARRTEREPKRIAVAVHDETVTLTGSAPRKRTAASPHSAPSAAPHDSPHRSSRWTAHGRRRRAHFFSALTAPLTHGQPASTSAVTGCLHSAAGPSRVDRPTADGRGRWAACRSTSHPPGLKRTDR